MKRGSDTQRQRGDDRRIETLRVPAASIAPARAAALDQPSASATVGAIGFSTSAGDAALEKRQRHVQVRDVGTATVTASTLPQQIAGVGHARRPYFAAISLGAARLGVHDADQLDAVHRREQPRVVLAEMADADDGDA